MNGNKKALAQIGNNHGSLVQLGADAAVIAVDDFDQLLIMGEAFFIKKRFLKLAFADGDVADGDIADGDIGATAARRSAPGRIAVGLRRAAALRRCAKP